MLLLFGCSAGLIDEAGLEYQNVVQHERVAKPLTAATGLERIPTKRVTSPAECPLCLESLAVGSIAATLPCCGKLFHHSTVRPHTAWAADPHIAACCGIQNWCAARPYPSEPHAFAQAEFMHSRAFLLTNLVVCLRSLEQVGSCPLCRQDVTL